MNNFEAMSSCERQILLQSLALNHSKGKGTKLATFGLEPLHRSIGLGIWTLKIEPCSGNRGFSASQRCIVPKINQFCQPNETWSKMVYGHKKIFNSKRFRLRSACADCAGWPESIHFCRSIKTPFYKAWNIFKDDTVIIFIIILMIPRLKFGYIMSISNLFFIRWRSCRAWYVPYQLVSS